MQSANTARRSPRETTNRARRISLLIPSALSRSLGTKSSSHTEASAKGAILTTVSLESSLVTRHKSLVTAVTPR